MIQKCSQGANNCCNSCGDDVCCIDTHRIYDSSRSQDCLESLRVILPPGAACIIQGSSNIAVKDIKIIWAQITTTELPFNCGYFQVKVRYYFYISFTACGADGVPREFEGLALADKDTVLFGGEGNVSVFTSDVTDEICPQNNISNVTACSNRPKVVLEVANPVSLGICVADNSCPTPYPPEYNAIPEQIIALFENGLDLSPDAPVAVYVSIGIFALIRIERKTQLIIPACEFCIPEADKTPVSVSDPCSLFCQTPFPVSEFYPSTVCDN